MMSRRSLLQWTGLAAAAAAVGPRHAAAPRSVDLLDLNALHGNPTIDPRDFRWTVDRTHILDHRLVRRLRPQGGEYSGGAGSGMVIGGSSGSGDAIIALLTPASAVVLTELLRFDSTARVTEIARQPLAGLDAATLAPTAQLLSVRWRSSPPTAG